MGVVIDIAGPPNVMRSIQLLLCKRRLVDSFHPGREDFIPAG